MTKEQRTTVSEYVTSLYDDDLRFISIRLIEKMCGDLAEVLNFLSQNQLIDQLLASANSWKELFQISDQIKDIVSKECKKRNISPKYIS